MTERDRDADEISQSWDTYWHGAHDSAAYSSGGTSHPLVLSFWSDYFNGIREQHPAPTIIDIASGNGAIVECAQSVFGRPLPEFTCVDISESAIAMLCERFPGVNAVVADANSIPLEAGAFDIATSQFGIEYAGREALDEMARLVAPGGQIALLLHYRDGRIYLQCSASLSAIRKLKTANFLPLLSAVFETGFAARGGANPSDYNAAAKELGPAIREVESIMMEYGRDVADGTIVRLYRDVRAMLGRMQHYEPSEVRDWLHRMQDEINAYAGRMDSMCNSAIDAAGFDDVRARLRQHDFSLLQHEPLLGPENPLAMAWTLVAQKQ